MKVERTNIGSVAGETAVQKAWNATGDIDSTTMACTDVSTRPSMSK
jgi:hypothetical protein